MPAYKLVQALENRSRYVTFLPTFGGGPVKLIAKKITRPQESAPAMQELFESRKIDVFWMVPDITVYYPDLTQHMLLWSFRNRVPVLSFNAAFREYGALAAIEFDQRDIGRQAGQMAMETLESGRAAARRMARFTIRTNEVVARNMGIPLSVKHVAENDEVKIQ